jgi:hypothetical protein
MNTYSLRFLLVAIGFTLSVPLLAEPVLIGNTSLSTQSLDADSVKAVLLGKKITIGDTRVVIIIAKTSDSQEAFLKERVGMTTSQLQTYWRRLFMTGGGTAPKIVETEADALKLASETPGGVAITDRTSIGNLSVLFPK